MPSCSSTQRSPATLQSCRYINTSKDRPAVSTTYLKPFSHVFLSFCRFLSNAISIRSASRSSSSQSNGIWCVSILAKYSLASLAVLVPNPCSTTQFSVTTEECVSEACERSAVRACSSNLTIAQLSVAQIISKADMYTSHLAARVAHGLTASVQSHYVIDHIPQTSEQQLDAAVVLQA